MRTIRKFLCLLLALLILCLAGCGGVQTEPTAAAQPTQAPQQEQVPQATPGATTPSAFSTERESAFEADGSVNLTVTEIPFTQRAEEEFASREQFRAMTKAVMVDDIPALIAYPDNDSSKPIWVTIHSGGGSKEDRIWTVFHADRCIWVSFDVAGYGESPRGGMTDGEAIIQAIADMDKLIAYCSTLPGADLNRIIIEGSSMGASTVFAYLAYGHFTPALAMADLPTADFTTAPDTSPLFLRHGGERPTPDLSMDQMRQLLAAYSPHLQAERMMDTYILAGMGLQDTIADTPSCQRLEETFRTMGKENFDFRYYETGHGMFPDDFGQEREELFGQVVNGKLVAENQPVPVFVNGTQLAGPAPEGTLATEPKEPMDESIS